MARAPRAPRVAWLKKAMAAGGEFHHQKKNRVTHNLINLAATAGVFGAFVGIAASALALPWWVHLPAAGALYACLLFSMYILIIHECSHDMFLLTSDRAKTKKLNHWIGRITAMPLFTAYVEHWEEGHVAHHLYPGEIDKDPQDARPLTGKPLWTLYAKALLIPGYFATLNPSAKYPGAMKRLAIGLVFWTAVGALGGYLVGWTVPASIALGFQWVVILNWMKKAQEHGCGLVFEPDLMLRSRSYFYPTQKLTSPFNIHYHFEHHINFNVPWYSLPAYHKKVRELMPLALHPYYNTEGSVEFFKQLNGTKPLVPPELRHLIQVEQAAVS